MQMPCVRGGGVRCCADGNLLKCRVGEMLDDDDDIYLRLAGNR